MWWGGLVDSRQEAGVLGADRQIELGGGEVDLRKSPVGDGGVMGRWSWEEKVEGEITKCRWNYMGGGGWRRG